jgi:arylsulfatase A-like enzyme
MVACLDDGVGGVLEELATQKLDGKTLVIFMSDNGAEPPGSNEPLSGGKHGYKEGGVRVPWVARLPGVIPANAVRDDVVHAIDFLPTMLAAAGVRPPADLKLDGNNVWAAFTGDAPAGERTIYFSDRGMRRGNWKLLNGQLFDLAVDPQEKDDVAAKRPDVRDRLAAESQRWAELVGIVPVRPAGE